jgi:hypothetical protein
MGCITYTNIVLMVLNLNIMMQEMLRTGEEPDYH